MRELICIFFFLQAILLNSQNFPLKFSRADDDEGKFGFNLNNTLSNYWNRTRYVKVKYRFTNDTSITTTNLKFTHVLGIEGGYNPNMSTYIYGYNGNYNLYYIFRYKYFATGLTLGIVPFTRYSSINKSYAFIGITSNPERLLSANFLIGIGSQTITDPIQTNPPHGVYRVLNIGGVYIKPGIFIRLSKSKRYLVSITSCITPYVQTLEKGYHPSNGIAIFPNFGISKILKKK